MQQVAGFTKKSVTIFFRTHFENWIAVSIWIHL